MGECIACLQELTCNSNLSWCTDIQKVHAAPSRQPCVNAEMSQSQATWDCYSPGKPEAKFSTYLESILSLSLCRSQVSSLMKKVLCTLALPFLYFDFRYHWLCLIVSLLQSNLLKRSKQNTRSQIHRWYNSIDFSSITPGIDPAVTVSITVSGKEVYLLS